MTAHSYRLSIERAHEVQRIIDPVFLNSPQFISDSLSRLLGFDLVCKLETLNPIRSFKGRGTEVFAANAKPGERLYCASAGNFGQAMAYSCTRRNVPLTVYASVNANPYKIERMRELGADVVLYGADFDAAKLEGKRQAAAAGATFVEDGQDIESLEGTATIGLELLRFPRKIDSATIALGNGAFLNGIARILKHYQPSLQVVAVQANGAPAMVESWRTGKLIAHESINTIADGIGVRIPIPVALTDMQGLVDDALLVEESSIIEAMKLFHRHLGIVVEPSGAVGLAALLENKERFKGQTVATIVCGGNLTAEQMDRWL
ncbi:MAG: pyridoxal-phosphate dependent enzyme [Cyclobacteriaceae bacterium]|nr:pyridoxal-phosphate dependent enzyme [Cyclobacteriaceae bacterium]